MSRSYDFSLAAALGAARVIQATGTRCKLIAASGPVQVRTDGGAVYDLLPGQGFNMPQGEAFREIFLSNGQATVNDGTLFVGDETFIDDRITGDVNVIDNSAAKTLMQTQFTSNPGKVAVAAKYGAVLLRATTRRLAIRKMAASSSIAGQLEFFICSGVPDPGTAPSSGAGTLNKSIGATAGTAVRWYCEPTLAQAGAADFGGAAQIFAPYAMANTLVEMPLTTPLVLPLTYFIGVHSRAVNRDINLYLDFEEL